MTQSERDADVASAARPMVRTVIACIAYLLAASAGSQVPAAYISGSRLVGGDWEDIVDNMVRAVDGKLYLYGRQVSTFAPGLSSSRYTNAGLYGAFVARVDPVSLATDWVTIVGRQRSRLFSLDDHDVVDGFAMGADGNVYVAAYASSARYPEAGGAYTGWGGAKYIYRLDAQGNATPYAGPLDPAIRTIRALAVDAQGNAYLSGRAGTAMATTAGAIATGPQVAVAADSGPYLVKIDRVTRKPAYATFLTIPRTRTATPDEQFCRESFRDALTSAFAIAVAPDGSVYLGGQANPEDLPATAGATDTLDTKFRDAFVARVSASGTSMLFVARFGGSDNDRVTSLIVGADGNVTVAGKWLDKGSWFGPRGGFQSTIYREWGWGDPFCQVTHPAEAGFLLRISSTGVQVGVTAMIGAMSGDLSGHNQPFYENARPIRIAADAGGHVYIVGTTNPGQSLPTLAPLVPDAVFHKYGSIGTQPFVLKVRLSDFSLAWGSRFGAREGFGSATALAVDTAGNVFVAGNTAWPEAFPVVNAPSFGRPFRFSSGFVTRIHEAPADLVLTASPSAAMAGAQVQLTAKLGDRQYAGSIEFRDRGVVIGTVPLVAGTARLTLPFPAGIRQLSATVRGAGVWNGNTSAPLTLVVQQTSANQ
jgi:hypothetical protein